MNRSTLPIVSILDEKNTTAFKAMSEVVFIAYLTSKDADLKSTFTELAIRNHRRFAFGIASGASVNKAGSTPLPSIVCYKIGEGEQEILSGQSGIDALEKFMEMATVALIGEMTRRNEIKYLKARHPT
jgi:protein disulfide-isomerase A1